MKTKEEFIEYLVKELNWTYAVAKEWCELLVLKGMLKEDKSE